jgi:outer membrane biosynthesis protein TonB
MNWAWPSSLDEIWHSATFPMWLTLAAAGFFALILLITLLRAERSVANGALTVITLLAIGVAVAATIRGFGSDAASTARGTQPPQSVTAALPALSCIDDLAGETALAACEKALFGSADAAAAAVSYAAARLTQLTSFGDVAAANKSMTPELATLRRSVERDRYGLMAYVLSARDRCQPAQCAAYRSLTDHNQIAANMDERVYEGLILRYSPSWNAPAPAATAALPPTLPTGKPTTADFPSAASTPPVSIMTPEPPVAAAPAAPRPPPAAANAQTPAPRPAPAPNASKKQAAPKTRAAAPVQLSPAPGTPAAAPAATDD